ncbi:MAG: class III signal peptide-containing protein [Candidatus Micrarchaeota archaeon]
MKKGQGAFEYILLLAGILLIVVIVIVVLKGGIIGNEQTNIQQSSELAWTNANTFCLSWCGEGAWDYINSSAGYNASCTTNMACLYDPDSATRCNETSAQQYAGQIAMPRNARACSFFVGTA